MPNHQYTSLLCLGAMLASVTLSWLNKFCQIRQSQTTDAFKSHYQHLEGDSALNWQPMQLLQHWCYVWSCLLVHVISLAALFWTHCNRAVCDNGMLCNVLMTVCIDDSYMRHTQQSHDLSSSDVDPCELPDSLCGVMVKPYHRQLSRSNLRTPWDDVLV